MSPNNKGSAATIVVKKSSVILWQSHSFRAIYFLFKKEGNIMGMVRKKKGKMMVHWVAHQWCSIMLMLVAGLSRMHLSSVHLELSSYTMNKEG
mmetsp:Transcript_10878/g.16873  ORF Transcript_10878/g.16873 Transcript_10878/m.16873 type:complete len:93 (-) Transcript_10878:119-397(-)